MEPRIIGKKLIIMKFINNLYSFTSSDLAGFCNYSLLLLCKEGWLKVLDEPFCCQCQSCCRIFIGKGVKTICAMQVVVGMVPNAALSLQEV